jgi:hypothetical protein
MVFDEGVSLTFSNASLAPCNVLNITFIHNIHLSYERKTFDGKKEIFILMINYFFRFLWSSTIKNGSMQFS